MIAIVDYGVGNLFSLASSLKSLGLTVEVTRDADKLCAATHIILPGVGAFADAMDKLTATGLVPAPGKDAPCVGADARIGPSSPSMQTMQCRWFGMTTYSRMPGIQRSSASTMRPSGVRETAA